MYASSSDLQAWVQGDVDASTADLLLELAAGEVEGYVGATLERTEYTETFGVNSPEFSADRTRLWLVPAGWPVEVAEVSEGGSTLTAGDGYRLLTEGSILRIDAEGDVGEWGDEVEVTYTTGFTSGDAALTTAKRITLEVAARVAANPQALESLTADGVSATFGPGMGLEPDQRRDLHRHRWRRVTA